jgi:hypothetical protein
MRDSRSRISLRSWRATSCVGWAKPRARERASGGVPTVQTTAMAMVGTARRARLCPPYDDQIVLPLLDSGFARRRAPRNDGFGFVARHERSEMRGGRSRISLRSWRATSCVGWAKPRARERASGGVPTVQTTAMAMVGTAPRARLCPPYDDQIVLPLLDSGFARRRAPRNDGFGFVARHERSEMRGGRSRISLRSWRATSCVGWAKPRARERASGGVPTVQTTAMADPPARQRRGRGKAGGVKTSAAS